MRLLEQMLVLKERQNNDKRADTDENVRKVEDRKADKPEIEEVNDIGSGGILSIRFPRAPEMISDMPTFGTTQRFVLGRM